VFFVANILSLGLYFRNIALVKRRSAPVNPMGSEEAL
jgi:hypothetical protein